jgi:coenzyme F420-dependent glucose-6-phosphate dehydrogenase
VRIGYKASAEQFGPRELVEFSVVAERNGLEIVAVSDHFQPWRHHGSHTPSALTWMGAAGEATGNAVLGTSVLTPTLRYHPSVIAQAFATLGALHPGRVFLGVGSGEAMNETPATGGVHAARGASSAPCPRRSADPAAVDRGAHRLPGRLSTGRRGRRSTTGPRGRCRSSWPPRARLAAKLAGQVGDGFICTSGTDPKLYASLLEKLDEGARRRPGPGGDPAHH